MRRKVLHLISDLDVAGAQTVVMNYLRKFYNDRDYEIHVAITGIYKILHTNKSAKKTVTTYHIVDIHHGKALGTLEDLLIG